jgi:hypothetical protein
MSLSAARPCTPISGRTTYHGIPAPKCSGIALPRVLVKISGQFLQRGCRRSVAGEPTMGFKAVQQRSAKEWSLAHVR